MAKAKAKGSAADTAETSTEETSTRGRKIMLPSGEARVDYIRRRFYDEGATRSDIRKELCELTGEDVVYQIVFAATKTKEKPVPKEPGAKSDAEGESES